MGGAGLARFESAAHLWRAALSPWALVPRVSRGHHAEVAARVPHLPTWHMQDGIRRGATRYESMSNTPRIMAGLGGSGVATCGITDRIHGPILSKCTQLARCR